MTDSVRPPDVMTREELDAFRLRCERWRHNETREFPYSNAELDAVVRTAKAGLFDTARVDWLTAMIEGGEPDPGMDYDQDAKVWRWLNGQEFKTLRDGIDFMRSTSSGQRDGDPA